MVWARAPTGAVAMLAGFTSDLDATAMLYESLHLQAASADGGGAPRDAGGDAALAAGVPVRVRGTGRARSSARPAATSKRTPRRRPAPRCPTCRAAPPRSVRSPRRRSDGSSPASAPAAAVAGGWSAGHREASQPTWGGPGWPVGRSSGARRERGAARVGRGDVYAAEEDAFGGTDLDAETSLEALVALAATVTAGEWWSCAGHPACASRRRRSPPHSSSARGRRVGRACVRLAGGQLTPGTLTHELAHALAGVDAGHDGRFRAAHVDVVAFVAGAGAAADLARAYGAAGLTVGRSGLAIPRSGGGGGFDHRAVIGPCGRRRSGPRR